MSDGEKGWVYQERDILVFRASSLGSCTRSLVAAVLGEHAAPFNETIRTAMNASAALEDKAIEEYRRQTGHDVIWQQKRVELDVMDKVVVRGHIDGLDQTTDEILEVKAMSATNFANYEAGGLDAMKPYTRKYKWQGAAYGHATERRVRYVILNKQPEKADGEPVINYDAVYDPEELVPRQEIVDRISFILSCAEADELPDCDADCRESDPYGECHIFESVKEGDAELLTLLARHQELVAILGSADKGTGLLGEKEAIRERIKEEYGQGKHVVGPFTANIVQKRGAERINTKRLRKERPDVAEEFMEIGAPSVQLIVTGGERDE